MPADISNPSNLHHFKWIKRIGIFLILSELILSAFLYLERTSFCDVAFQTFEIARTGQFPTQVYRFGSMLTHFYPWLAVKLGLTLKSVALFYSIGVVVYNALIFCYLAFVKKSYQWTLVFVLYSSMLITHMFFWIQSEYSQAIPFLILVFAFSEGLSFSYHRLHLWVIALGLILTAVFFHPLIIVLFSFVLPILLMADSLDRTKRWQYGLLWVMGVGIYLVKRFYFDNYYDHDAQDRIQNFVNLFPNYFSTQSTNMFFRNSYTIYIGGWLSMALLLWMWIKQRRFLKLLFGSILVMAYFFFINVTHPVADLFYLENMYLGIPLIIAMLLVFWTDEIVLPKLKVPVSTLLASALSILCIMRLSLVSQEYTQRLIWIRNLIQKFDGQKVIIPHTATPYSLLKNTWANVYENWLVSTIEQGKTASIMITDNVPHFLEKGGSKNVFVSYHIQPYDSFPKQYFKFTDTVNIYKLDSLK